MFRQRQLSVEEDLRRVQREWRLACTAYRDKFPKDCKEEMLREPRGGVSPSLLIEEYKTRTNGLYRKVNGK